MTVNSLLIVLAGGAPSSAPMETVDAAEVGRVAFVRFAEAAGGSAADPVLEGLEAALRRRHGITMVEQRACTAPDLDAMACLRGAEASIGAVLRIGAATEPDAPVIASVDCPAGRDRFARLLGGPFRDEDAARRWGAGTLADAVLERVQACGSVPARVRTENALPPGTVVALDGRRLTTLESAARLEVTSIRAGRRRLEFDAEGHAIRSVEVDARPHETATVRVDVDSAVGRPRWLVLAVAGAGVAAGAGLFVARHAQRSGDCVSFSGDCGLDGPPDARVAELGIPATMLVAGGAGLAVAELAIPRNEPWWWGALAGAAAAGLSVVPWLW